MPKFISTDTYKPQLNFGKDYLEQLKNAEIELEVAKRELLDDQKKILSKLETLINQFVQEFQNHYLIDRKIFIYNSYGYNYSKTDDHPLYSVITRFTNDKDLTPAEASEILTDCINRYLTNFYRENHFGDWESNQDALITTKQANIAGKYLKLAFDNYITQMGQLDTQLHSLQQKVCQCEQNINQRKLKDMVCNELEQTVTQAFLSIINEADQKTKTLKTETEKNEARGIRGLCEELLNSKKFNCLTFNYLLGGYTTLKCIKDNTENNQSYGCKKYKQITNILEAHEKNLLSVSSPNFCENLIKEFQQEITEIENNVSHDEQETQNTQQPSILPSPLSFFQRFSLAAANYTSQLIKQPITVPVLNEKKATEALKIILQQYIEQREQETVKSDINQTSFQEDDQVIINTQPVRTREYTGPTIFQKFQVGFSDKQKACETLQAALDGKPGELVNHLRALENGTLSKKLNQFIKNGHADSIVGTKVISIKQFVTLLEEKNNTLNNQSQQGINTL